MLKSPFPVTSLRSPAVGSSWMSKVLKFNSSSARDHERTERDTTNPIITWPLVMISSGEWWSVVMVKIYPYPTFQTSGIKPPRHLQHSFVESGLNPMQAAFRLAALLQYEQPCLSHRSNDWPMTISKYHPKLLISSWTQNHSQMPNIQLFGCLHRWEPQGPWWFHEVSCGFLTVATGMASSHGKASW